MERNESLYKTTLSICTFTTIRLVFPKWFEFVPLNESDEVQAPDNKQGKKGEIKVNEEEKWGGFNGGKKSRVW